MKTYDVKPGFSEPTARVKALKNAVLDASPRIEADRARLITESYKETEGQPVVLRHALGLKKILEELPVIIRENELIVGTATIQQRSCQMFPEFGPQGLTEEWETVSTRSADPFALDDDTKAELKEIFDWWGKETTSSYALSLMDDETKEALAAGVFTVGNYLAGGVGHFCVNYEKIIKNGIVGVINEVISAMQAADKKDPEWINKEQYYKAVLITLNAAVTFANRYADKAEELARTTNDSKRKQELLKIAEICRKVPEHPATTYYEALQSFWFIQLIIQIEGSGHSISPGRFDQYMDPFYQADPISQEDAQELLDCLFVKFNDINKLRDIGTATAFAGYQMWQNINCGGQTVDGLDATNATSYMEIEAMAHLMLAMPSLSLRIWNGSPDEFLMKGAELARLGGGQPAFYNDEEIIPAKVNRGIPLEEARNYGIVGCVEPNITGKEHGWHDAALFNLPKVLEVTMENGRLNGKQFGPQTGEFADFTSYEEFCKAYETQMEFFVKLLVRADNSVDYAHRKYGQLAFVSTMVDDCIGRGKTMEEGGAIYNFIGPQGIGSANMGNAFYNIKKLVFEDKKFTMAELKEAMDNNWGKPLGTINPVTGMPNPEVAHSAGTTDMDAIVEAVKKILGESTSLDLSKLNIGTTTSTNGKEARYQEIHKQIMESDKYGNDLDEVDMCARYASRVYCEILETYPTPRGGCYQAGLYPVSGNVLFGSFIAATPDGRYKSETIAEGVSPTRGTDVLGPTAAANSVSKLDHFIASNGTLYNMKFSPDAVAGQEGLARLSALIRGYFDRKGGHVQFNIMNRELLLDAQRNPQNYKDLIVRVAGYSAQFIYLDKTVQDDIIARTEFSRF